MVRTLALALPLCLFIANGALADPKPSVAIHPKSGTVQSRDTLNLSGHLDVLGQVATFNGGTDGKHILVDLSLVSRDQRNTITAKCSPDCEVRITGYSGVVLYEQGVVATNLAVVDPAAPPKVASE